MSNTRKLMVIGEEHRDKMILGIKKSWEIKNIERYGDKYDPNQKKCIIDGCTAEDEGKINFRIVEGVRYCDKHGHKPRRLLYKKRAEEKRIKDLEKEK